MPKKFIALVDVGLNANDEYSSGIDDIYLGIYTADSEEDALTKVKADWDNRESIESLGDWVTGYSYGIKVIEVTAMITSNTKDL